MKVGQFWVDVLSNVGANFNVDLRTRTGENAQTSMNCHYTNTSIHLQLNKGTKGRGGWEEKMKCFYYFVYFYYFVFITLSEMTEGDHTEGWRNTSKKNCCINVLNLLNKNEYCYTQAN